MSNAETGLQAGWFDLLEGVEQQVSNYLYRLPKNTLTPDRLRQKGLLLVNLGDVPLANARAIRRSNAISKVSR